MGKFLVIDLETTGLSDLDDQIHGVGYASEEDGSVYEGSWALSQDFLNQLKDPSIAKIGFNVLFDLGFLARAGYEIQGKIYDVQQMAKLVDENQPLNLKDLSLKYLGPESLKGKKRLDQACKSAGVRNVAGLCKLDLLDKSRPCLEVISFYCKEDVENTLKLFYVLREKLGEISNRAQKILGIQETPQTYFLKEVAPVTPVLFDIQQRGVRVNTDIIAALRTEVVEKSTKIQKNMEWLVADAIKEIEKELYKKVVSTKKSEKGRAKVQKSCEKSKTKFNWSSGRHIGQLVYEKLGVGKDLIKHTDSGQYDTSEDYLRFVGQSMPKNSVVAQLLREFAEFKKLGKLISTYTGDAKRGISSFVRYNAQGIPYIYPKYPQKPVTGRLSSTSPNFQNLGRGTGVKRFFIPTSPNHVFAYLDYSQVELRIAAHLSRDEKLVEAYEMDKDIHKQTASQIFGVDIEDVTKEQRQSSKTCNFLLIYAGSAYRLHQELAMKGGLDYTIDQCQAFRERYFDYYRQYKAHLQKLLQFMVKYRLIVSEAGCIRRLQDIVYGDFLNHRQQRFTGPQDLVDKLKETPYERLEDPKEIYYRAKGRYNHAVKQGYNHPVQSVGASITKRALVKLHEKGYKIISTVHDSIIIELHKKEVEKIQDIQHIMETAYPLSVPLKAESKLLNSFDESDIYDPKNKKE